MLTPGRCVPILIRGLDSSAGELDGSPPVAAGGDSGGGDCSASIGLGVSDSGGSGAAGESADINGVGQQNEDEINASLKSSCQNRRRKVSDSVCSGTRKIREIAVD